VTLKAGPGPADPSSMKHFRCGDVIPGCTATFSGSEQDILEQVTRHARDDHGMSDIPAGLADQVRSKLVSV
jgi:predicted small metal-binding protein